MAVCFVPAVIATVERTMESLRLHEGLKADDKALLALGRKVALGVGELIRRDSRMCADPAPVFTRVNHIIFGRSDTPGVMKRI
jgi:hypothetical protein